MQFNVGKSHGRDKELDRIGSLMGKATKKQTTKDQADCVSGNIPE